ncbi:MAG: TolC family protein [Bdellovibrionota bacterium]
MFFVLIAVALFSISPCFGWGWEDAKTQLEEQNPDLINQSKQVLMSYYSLSDSKSLFYPDVSLSAGFERFLQENATLGYRAFVGPRITWSVFEGGRRFYQKNLAESRLTEQEAQQNAARLSQLKKLKEIFSSALFYKRYYFLSQELLKRTQENLRYVNLKYQSGSEYQWAYLSQKADVSKDELRLEEIERDQTSILQELKLLLGELPIEHVKDIQENSFDIQPTISQSQIGSFDGSQHPTYTMFNSKVEQSEELLKISKSKSLPQLGFRTDFVAYRTDDNPFVPFWYAGVNFSMPIYSVGRNKRGKKSAMLALEQSLTKSAQTKEELVQSVEVGFQSYNISKKRLEIARQELEAIEQKNKVFREQYHAGLIGFIEWNRNETELQNQKIAVLQRKKDVDFAYTSLEYSMGEIK